MIFLKKFISGIIVGTIISITSIGVFATSQSYTLTKSDSPIIVDNVQYVSQELPIMNYEGSTYVPLRAISEMLGAEVNWNNDTRTIEIVSSNNTTSIVNNNSQTTNPVVDTTSDLVVNTITSPISNNETATLSVIGSPNTEYSISVYYGSGASTASGLEVATSDNNGIVSWSWKIGGNTNVGTYRIVIQSIDGTQQLETSITIQ